MLCQYKFQPKHIQYFLCDNCTEQHNPHHNQEPGVPQVTGLDIVWLHELHDHEEPYETQDKKQCKVKPLRKEHKDGNDSKPETEDNCCNLFLSHQDPFLYTISSFLQKGHRSKRGESPEKFICGFTIRSSTPISGEHSCAGTSL